MNLTEAKALYVDHIVKDQGYKDNEDIQLIFRSELNWNKRIVCLIKDEPYLLPESIANSLRNYFTNGGKGLPESVTFYAKKEWFRVPFAYFVSYSPLDIKTVTLTTPVATTLQPISLEDAKPAKRIIAEGRSSEDVDVDPEIYDILEDSVKSYIKTRETLPFLQEFAKLSGCKDVKSLLLSNVEIAYGTFISEPTDEVLSTLITNLLLYNYNK